jgi:pyruvate dehydrogenase E1 component alpha subunit
MALSHSNSERLPFLLNAASKEQLSDALLKMHQIRCFEEGAEDSYIRGLIHGTMHLSIGQEGSAVGVCMMLNDTDQITSTHRGHGHCVAKGADLKLMFAEFFGKEEGYCKGRGGSMHIADVGKGNLGANGIVGGGLPIAVGAALANKKLGNGKVVVCFFGDGASNEGAFHEALNMASVWKLPVVFVCENNGYGMSTSTARSTAVQDIADRASAYNMPGHIVDGNSISDVAEVTDTAVRRARDGQGPTLVECKTYRWRGHSKSDRNRYRTTDEIEAWKKKDPIKRFENLLCEYQLFTTAEIDAIATQGKQDVETAIEFARHGTDPDPLSVERDVYSRPIAASLTNAPAGTIA